MAFQKTLSELVERAEKKGEEELTRRLKAIASRVATALRGRWEDFEKETLAADSKAAGEAIAWLDAAECVDQRMLTDKQAKILELPVSGVAAVDRQRLVELFQAARVARRGYVVVAYDDKDRKSPVVYVGRGQGAGTVRFAGSNRLASAAQQSTGLAFLFPRSGTQSKLKELEGSVICLVRAQTGENPVFNSGARPEPPASEAHERFDALSDLLETAGVYIFNEAFAENES